MKSLTGKVALISGSSRGIGRGVAERLGRDGAKVVVNYSSSQQEAEEVVQALRDAGGESVAVQANLSRVEEVRRLTGQTICANGGAA